MLIAIAGERLMKKGQSGKTDQPPSDDLEKAEKALKSHARGYSEFVEYDPSDDEPDWEERDYDDGPPGRYVTRKGVLRTPEAPLQPARFSNLVEPLKLLRERLVGEASHVIFAFDSLDRLSDP